MGTLLTLDASNGTHGTALTVGNVGGLAQSVTNQTAITTPAAFYKDSNNRMWYRFLTAPGGSQTVTQVRWNLTDSKVQSVRGRLRISSLADGVRTIGQFIGSSATAARVVYTSTSKQLSLQGASPYTTIATTTVSGGLDPNTDYEFYFDLSVGTSTSTGVASVKVCAAGSTTPLAGGSLSTTTGNFGTTAITVYDIGSNDQAVGSIDLRWTNLQTENDRAVYPTAPPSLGYYDQTIAPTVPTGNYDIVIGWGQSNMAGPVYSTDTTNTYDANGVDAYPSNVFEFRNGSIVLAHEPLWSPDLNNAGMGAGNTFLKDYAASSLASGRQVLMVMCAYRGTGFSLPASGENTAYSWRVDAPNDGTNLYENAKTRVTAALAAAGAGSQVVAIIANHGSTDGTNNTPKATFKAWLQAAITGFRTWLGQPTVPFIMMQMRPDLIATQTKHQIIADAQAETADELQAVMYALSPGSTTDSTYFKSDSVHFNVLGQRQIGHNMYAQFVAPPAGSGGVTATAAVTGAGSSMPSGSGAALATAAVVGSGATVAQGSGSTTLTASVSGAGTKVTQGVGASLATATVSGAGSSVSQGTGSATAIATVAGSGSAPVVGGAGGSGAVTVTATVAGSGARSTSGAGALTLTATAAGSGATARSGGGFVTMTATVSGSGSAPVIGVPAGSGSATVSATVYGTGSRKPLGSGAVLITATVWGSGANGTAAPMQVKHFLWNGAAWVQAHQRVPLHA